MTNINKWAIPKNIEKPVETVCEIEKEYQVPSFEEFMKDYQADDNLNYADLSDGSIGEVKGYGPCISPNSTCSRSELQDQLRKKERELEDLRSQLSRSISSDKIIIEQSINATIIKINIIVNIINTRPTERKFNLAVYVQNNGSFIGEDNWIQFTIKTPYRAREIVRIMRKRISGGGSAELVATPEFLEFGRGSWDSRIGNVFARDNLTETVTSRIEEKISDYERGSNVYGRIKVIRNYWGNIVENEYKNY